MPSEKYFLIVSAGVSGLHYAYALPVRSSARVELFIDRPGGAEENEHIFDQLVAQREAIESEFGEPLDWQRNEGTNPCRVHKYIDSIGWTDADTAWDEIQDALIDSMIRLDKSFGSRIRELNL